MQADSLLFCPKCNATTPHTQQAKYGHWGELSKNVERCTVCLAEAQSHEAPAADSPLLEAPLTDMEICRCLFVRRLIARGVFSDYPHEPGVWGRG